MSEYSRMITMSEKTLREMLKDIGDGAAYEGKHWQFCNHYENVDDEELGKKFYFISSQGKMH